MQRSFFLPLDSLRHLTSSAIDSSTFPCRAYKCRFRKSRLGRTTSVCRYGCAKFLYRFGTCNGSHTLHTNKQKELFHCNVGLSRQRHRHSVICRKVPTEGREWQEYENAEQDVDLDRALEILDLLQTFESDTMDSSSELESSFTRDDKKSSNYFPAQGSGTPAYLEILNVCGRSADLTQVGKAYNWLQMRGFLSNFGKFKASASDGERLVTEAVLKDSIGLGASKLSPKKWGLNGDSTLFLIAAFALFSFVVDSGAEIRPVAVVLLGLGMYDAIYLGGSGFVQIRSMWLPYRRRVLVHEAGHVLVAYLLGCPVRAVILDPVKASEMQIQGQVHAYVRVYLQDLGDGREGVVSMFCWSLVFLPGLRLPDNGSATQAGTQFWDQELQMELFQNRLTSETIDRYSIVLFAGIAAEAMIYGEAEGGESDENMFKSVVSLLQPSWSLAKMSNQARWAVLQAYKLLEQNKEAHAALVEALDDDADLGTLIRTIEESMA